MQRRSRSAKQNKDERGITQSDDRGLLPSDVAAARRSSPPSGDFHGASRQSQATFFAVWRSAAPHFCGRARTQPRLYHIGRSWLYTAAHLAFARVLVPLSASCHRDNIWSTELRHHKSSISEHVSHLAVVVQLLLYLL